MPQMSNIWWLSMLITTSMSIFMSMMLLFNSNMNLPQKKILIKKIKSMKWQW
uniref:ATP synthase F0 subunit 8 n=1 Tax=Teredorus anhuiensis TaxID=2979235 RepID=UPI0023AAD4C8|nr:ATP synthase F0 subunit 8 [Teredorus anhuiensis]WCF76524.1 ATP synthase F0 subunit 8 [Teredorus anhuiensis]